MSAAASAGDMIILYSGFLPAATSGGSSELIRNSWFYSTSASEPTSCVTTW